MKNLNNHDIATPIFALLALMFLLIAGGVKPMNPPLGIIGLFFLVLGLAAALTAWYGILLLTVWQKKSKQDKSDYDAEVERLRRTLE